MSEIAWLVLLVLSFPVMAIVGLVLGLKARGRLTMLEARVAVLEAELTRAASGRLPAPPLQPEGEAPALPQPPHGISPPPAAPIADAPPAAPQGLPPRQTPADAIPTLLRPAFGLGAKGPVGAAPPSLRSRVDGFEEKVGARWAVWVGGLALALGGVFLVRFAVEQDLIGPGLRIAFGLILAAALMAAGEVLRRRDPPPAIDRPLPYVPGILTGAGTMTAFGSIFAAYELYHLIPPAVAFLALALTAILTLLAALLHGPSLAALGFLGAALTPFLITSDSPNAWSVAGLIAAVAASALGVARVRLWRWLALLAIAGTTAWGLVLILFSVPQAEPAAAVLALVLLALVAVLATPGLLFGPRVAAPWPPDLVSTTAAAGVMAMVTLAAITGENAATPVILFTLAALGTLALAVAAPPATFAALAVAVAAPVLLFHWQFPADAGSALAPGGPVSGAVPEPVRLDVRAFAAFGLAMAALLGGLGFFAAGKIRHRLFALGWATAAAAAPVLLLVAAYASLTELDRSLPFAALALGLAAALTLAAEILTRNGRTFPAAAFAAGGVVALALALVFALEKGWLTVGLALSALAVAWVAARRPLPGLRQLAAGLGLVVLGRIVWDPTIAGTELGTTPILNWLLWGYGVPAAAFAGAAVLLGRDDWSRRVLECLALLFAVLLAAFEVRHLAHGGNVYAPGTPPFETGLLATVYAAYAAGLTRIAAASGLMLHRIFADAVAGLAALCAVAALTADNPFTTGEAVGGRLFNDLLLAYALPAGLFLLYAAGLPANRVQTRLAACGMALVLALAYVTLEVSRLFQGPVLDETAISQGEWYAWSAAWLGFGIALLGLGLWLRSRPLRLASAVVTGATVLKGFLSGMADLEGGLRALAFIGPGVVLVAMGWLYQRLLTRSTPPAAPATDGGKDDAEPL